MKFLQTKFVLTASAVTLALAVLASAPAQSQASAVITDRLEKNTIRSSHTKSQFSVRTAYLYDGSETGASKTEGTREYAMQEYVAESQNGRPTTLYRSYDQFTGKDISRLTEDGQPIEAPAVDMRSRQTFVFAIDGNGAKKLTNEFLFLDAKDLHNAASDNTPMLAPDGEAKVGATWEVSAQSFGFVGVMGADEKLSEAEISAALDGIKNDEAGRSLASVSFKATVKSNYRATNSFDGSEIANMNVEYTIAGKAAYLVGGRMVAFESAGTCKARGKNNGMDCAIDASFSFVREFSYGFLIDVAAENGNEGPAETTDLYTAKLGGVPENQIVLARNNGSIGRLQTFDPASRKVVKTVMALPKGLSLADAALSKDRKRIAFRSSGNNTISIAESNVFVLELENGILNQITPTWATNEGVAKALDTGKTCTVTGRIVWRDDEFNRDRTDGIIIGWVRVDHTSCFSTIDGTTGKFKLDNVPANTSVLISAFVNLPNYSNGKSRGEKFAPSGKASAMTVHLLDEGNKDIGDLRVNPPSVDYGYGAPTFGADGKVICNRYPGATVAIVGYPNRSWEEKEIDANLGLLTGGLSASPDGKLMSFVVDSVGGSGSVNFYNAAGKAVWSTGLAEGVEVSYTSQAAWLADSSGWVCTAGSPGWLGKDRFGMPGLLYASPSEKRVVFARKWPQLGGYSCKSIALNKEGTIAYLVYHVTNEKGVIFGDLWQWDSTTDTLSRLTNLGDVVGVANIGR